MSTGFVADVMVRYTPENGLPVTVDLSPGGAGVAPVSGHYTILVGTGLQYEPVFEPRETVNFEKRILKLGHRVSVNLQWDILFMVEFYPFVVNLLTALMQPGMIVELTLDGGVTWREMVIKQGAKLKPFRDKTFSGYHVDGPEMESKSLLVEVPLLRTGVAW